QSSELPFESINQLQNYILNIVSVNSTKAMDENQRKISLLIIELETYLYYLTTLQDYFTNLNINRFKQDEMGELCEFDKLARSRQLFAYSIAESQRIITSFRQKHNMDYRPPLA
ncbi:MAG: hypothetical protein WAW61_18000, partial [Methylococcaceae bacterium]